MKLSIGEIWDTVTGAGFHGLGAIIATAVALAESGGDSHNLSQNADSVDRGLFQFNSVAHSEVSDGCAYDPHCAAVRAYEISKGGTDWHQWAAFTNGSYRQFLAQVSALVGGGAVGSAVSQGSDVVAGMGESDGGGSAGRSPCGIANLGGCIDNAVAGAQGLLARAGVTLAWEVGLILAMVAGIYLLVRPEPASPDKSGGPDKSG